MVKTFMPSAISVLTLQMAMLCGRQTDSWTLLVHWRVCVEVNAKFEIVSYVTNGIAK